MSKSDDAFDTSGLACQTTMKPMVIKIYSMEKPMLNFKTISLVNYVTLSTTTIQRLSFEIGLDS